MRIQEIMTRDVITVAPETPLKDVARLMVDHSVNRLPVVSEDKLVGIVSRADLVRAFVRSDREIEREIREDILFRTMLLGPGEIDVVVESGVVGLQGQVRAKDDAELVERCVRRLPGVVGVDNALRCGALTV